jgi:putative flippase GtrA
MIYKLVRFSIIGALATLVHWSVVVFLYNTFSISPLIANFLGYIVAVIVSFYGHRTWVFLASDSIETRTKYVFISLSALALQQLLIYISIDRILLRFEILMILILVITAIYSFLLMERWAFKKI